MDDFELDLKVDLFEDWGSFWKENVEKTDYAEVYRKKWREYGLYIECIVRKDEDIYEVWLEGGDRFIFRGNDILFSLNTYKKIWQLWSTIDKKPIFTLTHTKWGREKVSLIKHLLIEDEYESGEALLQLKEEFVKKVRDSVFDWIKKNGCGVGIRAKRVIELEKHDIVYAYFRRNFYLIIKATPFIDFFVSLWGDTWFNNKRDFKRYIKESMKILGFSWEQCLIEDKVSQCVFEGNCFITKETRWLMNLDNWQEIVDEVKKSWNTEGVLNREELQRRWSGTKMLYMDQVINEKDGTGKLKGKLKGKIMQSYKEDSTADDVPVQGTQKKLF